MQNEPQTKMIGVMGQITLVDQIILVAEVIGMIGGRRLGAGPGRAGRGSPVGA